MEKQLKNARDDADRFGGVKSFDGRVAMLRQAEILALLAREGLDSGEMTIARGYAEEALDLVAKVADRAPDTPRLPAIRFDLEQILGTVAIASGDDESGSLALLRAASESYSIQPEDRVLSVAGPQIVRQLRDLWRASEETKAAARFHRAMKAVRHMLGHLEERVIDASTSLQSIDGVGDHVLEEPFHRALLRYFERGDLVPVPAAEELKLSVAELAANVDAGPAPRLAALVRHAVALRAVGRTGEAARLLPSLTEAVKSLPTALACDLTHQAVGIALDAFEHRVAIELGRAAVGIVEDRSGGDDPALAVDRARAWGCLGRALCEGEDQDAAIPFIEFSIAACGEVLAGTDVLPDALAAVADTAGFGAFLRGLSNDEEGMTDAHELARTAAMRMMEEHPGAPRTLNAVVEVALTVARSTVGPGKSAAVSAAVCGRMSDLLESIIAADPTDNLRRVRALSFLPMAAVAGAPQGSPDGAVPELLARAHELRKEALGVEPDEVWATFARSESLSMDSVAALRAGRGSTSDRLLKETIAGLERIVRMQPDSAWAHFELAQNSLYLARRAGAARDRRQARSTLERAVGASLRRLELQPDSSAAPRQHAELLSSAISIAAAIGEKRLKTRWMDELVAFGRDRYEDEPGDVDRLYDLISVLQQAGLVHGEGRAKGIGPIVEELVRLVERLETLDPLFPRLAQTVFEVHEAAAMKAMVDGDRVRILRHATRAVESLGAVDIDHDDAHEHQRSHLDLRQRIALMAAILEGPIVEEGAVPLEAVDLARRVLERHRAGLGPAGRSSATRDSAEDETHDDVLTDAVPRIVGAPSTPAHPLASPSDCGAAPDRDGRRIVLKAHNTGHPRAYFGVGLAATDLRIVVGAPGDASVEHHVLVNGDAEDRRAPGRGAVHVYRRDGETFVHDAYLKPPIPMMGMQFGWAVAIDGGSIVVGSPGAFLQPEDEVDPIPGETVDGTGAAWVFEDLGDGWRMTATLGPPSDVKSAQFGQAVAIEGDTILVGDHLADATGVVHVFQRTTDGWERTETLTPPHESHHSWFGASIALSGDRAVIGAPQSSAPSSDAFDLSGRNRGAAWVFRKDAEGWSPEVGFVGPEGGHLSLLGLSVAIREGVVVVGAPAWNASRPRGFGMSPEREGSEQEVGLHDALQHGTVCVFQHVGGSWMPDVTLEAPAPHGQSFGCRVAMGSDGRILVGASLDAHGNDWTRDPAPPDLLGGRGPRFGAAHVIARHVNGEWRIARTVAAEPPGTGDEFGSRVAWSGDALVIAAPNESSSGRGVDPGVADRDAYESGAVTVIDHG